MRMFKMITLLVIAFVYIKVVHELYFVDFTSFLLGVGALFLPMFIEKVWDIIDLYIGFKKFCIEFDIKVEEDNKDDKHEDEE